jgi:hypothetical protein
MGMPLPGEETEDDKGRIVSKSNPKSEEGRFRAAEFFSGSLIILFINIFKIIIITIK